MNRIELINSMEPNKYLEIGVQTGVCFFSIKAIERHGVDPDLSRLNINFISDPEKNKGVNFYHKSTSDQFFNTNTIKDFDVILIDGLHTFEQSLKDVLNSLICIKLGGSIILHDCFPPHEAAAIKLSNYPTKEESKKIQGWTGEWCGDVYKTIIYIKRKYPKLYVKVNNFDYGCGEIIPTFQVKNIKIDKKLFSEIDKITYKDLISNTNLINLV